MNEQQKKILDIVENAVACKYHEGSVTFQDYQYDSGWLLRPYTAITQVLHGKSEISTKKPDHRILREQGDTIYLRPTMLRRSYVPVEDGVDIIWARLSFTVFSGIDFLSFFDVPLKFDRKKQGSFLEILKALIQLDKTMQNSVLESAAKRQQLLYSLLLLIIQESRVKEESLYTISRLNRLAPALNYIKNNFKQNIEVDTLAELVFLSKSQFHRNFKKAFNISPIDYQKRLRLKEAQNLLLLSDLSIAEVTEATGYGDPFHFSRIFKSYSGISPLKYRQTNSLDKISI